MKVYEISWFHAKDWVCAESAIEAKEFYANQIGEHIDEIPEPRELTEKEAKESYILDIETYYDEIPEGEDEDDFSGGYRIETTMYEAAKGHVTPQYLATTEF